MARIAILGSGSWGSALAKTLFESGNEIRLWGHLEEEIAPIRERGRNEKYLPGVRLPKEILASTDLDRCLHEADATLINKSPYKDGWIVRLKAVDGAAAVSGLLSAAAAVEPFRAYMAENDVAECTHCEGYGC